MKTTLIATLAAIAWLTTLPASADDEAKSPLATPFSADAPGMTPETDEREAAIGGATADPIDDDEGYDSPTPELSDSGVDATTTGGDAHGD